MENPNLLFTEMSEACEKQNTVNMLRLKDLVIARNDFQIVLDTAKGRDYMFCTYIEGSSDRYGVSVERMGEFENLGSRCAKTELMKEIYSFLICVRFLTIEL